MSIDIFFYPYRKIIQNTEMCWGCVQYSPVLSRLVPLKPPRAYTLLWYWTNTSPDRGQESDSMFVHWSVSGLYISAVSRQDWPLNPPPTYRLPGTVKEFVNIIIMVICMSSSHPITRARIWHIKRYTAFWEDNWSPCYAWEDVLAMALWTGPI